MANNKTNKVLNVPSLRFPEFSGEWEKMNLGDVCSGFDYGMNSASKPFDGENQYIRITDIDESTCLYDKSDRVSPDSPLSDNYIVKKNDILLARTGASTGKSYLYEENDGKIYFAGFLIRINVNPIYNPRFIFQQLHTSRYNRWTKIMSARSGQPGINSQEYASFPIYSTSRDEQERIAKVFAILDERILTQIRIIETLQSLIKGIAKSFCSRGEKNIAIKDCLICHTSDLLESSVRESELYPVYGASGIVGYIDNYAIEGEAILIIKDGSGVGTVNYVKGKFSVIGTLNYLTAIHGFSLRYLYYCLLIFNFAPYKTGMAIPHIYFKDYGKAKIHYPTTVICQKTTSVLMKIEEQLSIETTLLKLYMNEKRYLLHRMFI